MRPTGEHGKKTQARKPRIVEFCELGVTGTLGVLRRRNVENDVRFLDL